MNSEIKSIPAPQQWRFYNGRIIGCNICVGAEYDGKQFFVEAVVDFPEEMQCWADELNNPQKTNELSRYGFEKTNLMMALYEKIYQYKTQQQTNV
jgi:hypothetical protein